MEATDMSKMNKHSKRFANTVVQLLSHVQLIVTPWTVARQALLSSTVSRRLLRFISIESVILSNHLLLCRLLLLLPLIFPASGSFPMSRLFASGGQSVGAQLQHQSFQRIFRLDFLQD